MFLAEVSLDLVEVEGRHRLAQVVEQFEDGQGLLGRPGFGDDDGSCPTGGAVVAMAAVGFMTCVPAVAGRAVRCARALP